MITHINDPNSDKVIVFIHGLGGSKYTWYSFIRYLNQKWTNEFGFLIKYFTYYRIIFDKSILFKFFNNEKFHFFINALFFIFEKIYFVIKAAWSKRNNHNVELLEKYITKNCNDSRNVILVAHSMGGLIARQYLINCKSKQIDIKKIKMLITYATPHKGSYIADNITINRFKYISKIYTNLSIYFNYRLSPQIGDLASLNEFIKNIETEWTNYNVASSIQFIRIVAKKDLLVKPESAMQSDREVNLIHEFNFSHSGIISPNSNNFNFDPIDVFIDELCKIDYEEEYYEELDSEINYDDDSEDSDSY